MKSWTKSADNPEMEPVKQDCFVQQSSEPFQNLSEPFFSFFCFCHVDGPSEASTVLDPYQ